MADGGKGKHDKKVQKTAAELRKINKPLMEKKRRERINSCLDQLKTFLTEVTKKEETYYSKLEKADVLEMTVKYLKSIERQQLAGTQCSEATTTGRYTAGYNHCVQEVARYLSQSATIEQAVRNQLVHHLCHSMPLPNIQQQQQPQPQQLQHQQQQVQQQQQQQQLQQSQLQQQQQVQQQEQQQEQQQQLQQQQQQQQTQLQHTVSSHTTQTLAGSILPNLSESSSSKVSVSTITTSTSSYSPSFNVPNRATNVSAQSSHTFPVSAPLSASINNLPIYISSTNQHNPTYYVPQSSASVVLASPVISAATQVISPSLPVVANCTDQQRSVVDSSASLQLIPAKLPSGNLVFLVANQPINISPPATLPASIQSSLVSAHTPQVVTSCQPSSKPSPTQLPLSDCKATISTAHSSYLHQGSAPSQGKHALPTVPSVLVSTAKPSNSSFSTTTTRESSSAVHSSSLVAVVSPQVPKGKQLDSDKLGKKLSDTVDVTSIPQSPDNSSHNISVSTSAPSPVTSRTACTAIKDSYQPTPRDHRTTISGATPTVQTNSNPFIRFPCLPDKPESGFHYPICGTFPFISHIASTSSSTLSSAQGEQESPLNLSSQALPPSAELNQLSADRQEKQCYSFDTDQQIIPKVKKESRLDGEKTPTHDDVGRRENLHDEKVQRVHVQGASVQHVQGAGVQHVQGASVQHVQGAGVQHVQGASVQHVQGASVQHVQGEVVQHVQGAGVQHVQGAGVPHVQGEGAQHVQGAGVQHLQVAGVPHVQGAGAQHVQVAGVQHVQGVQQHEQDADVEVQHGDGCQDNVWRPWGSSLH